MKNVLDILEFIAVIRALISDVELTLCIELAKRLTGFRVEELN